ncbi:MAG: MerC domain-containing protein [Verrucomicrobia bacterium]|nr:MerC domain-containing protein [Verrucomicrobiota bacterium]
MKKQTIETAALAEAKNRNAATGSKWLGGIASVLTSTAAIKCPFCIPALGALLTSIGLGAVATQVMHGVLIVLLLVSVGSLAWAAKFHRRWWVLPAWMIGAAAVYAGRNVWFEPVVMWLGVAVLVGTSLVNLRIKRNCCRCAEAPERKV